MLPRRHARPWPRNRRLQPEAAAVPISAPLAPNPKTRPRCPKPRPPPSPMRPCCTTSARSPSICTSSWPTAAPGILGMARCVSLTASATAMIASTASTAPPQACCTGPTSRPRPPGLASAAIRPCGRRCSTCWPGSTTRRVLGELVVQADRCLRRPGAGRRSSPRHGRAQDSLQRKLV